MKKKTQAKQLQNNKKDLLDEMGLLDLIFMEEILKQKTLKTGS
jgi:hypothetical protein